MTKRIGTHGDRRHFLKPLTKEELNFPSTIKDEVKLGEFKGQTILAASSCCARGICYNSVANTKTSAIMVTNQRLVILTDNEYETGAMQHVLSS